MSRNPNAKFKAAPPNKANLKVIAPPKSHASFVTELPPTQHMVNPINPETVQVPEDHFSWYNKADVQEKRQLEYADYLSPVLNQGQCGSCFAVSSTSVTSDRAAITTKITTQNPNYQYLLFSPTLLVSCATDGNNGCDGGYASNVGLYLAGEAIGSNPPGEGVALNSSCFPYGSWCPASSADCGQAPLCSDVLKKCDFPPAHLVLKSGPGAVHSIGDPAAGDTEAQIIADIKQSVFFGGPVAASFQVYDDFLLTTTQNGWQKTNGIYINGAYPESGASGSNLDGGHAVSIIGWGIDTQVPKSSLPKYAHDNSVKGDFISVPYWIVRNSWGSGWNTDGFSSTSEEGGPGYFKMAMTSSSEGINQKCGLDVSLQLDPNSKDRFGGCVAWFVDPVAAKTYIDTIKTNRSFANNNNVNRNNSPNGGGFLGSMGWLIGVGAFVLIIALILITVWATCQKR